MIGTIAPHIVDCRQAGRPIFQRHPCQQAGAQFLVDATQDANRIFALPAESRMHQQIGHLARGGEDQQALGVEIEPPDRNPALALESGQPLEHRRPLTGVVAAANFTGCLVIDQHLGRRLLDPSIQGTAIDPNLIVRPDSLADMRRLTIDRHTPCNDQLFHLAARSDAGIGEQFVQLGSVVIEDRASGSLRTRATLATRIGRIQPDPGLIRIDRNRQFRVRRMGPLIRGARSAGLCSLILACRVSAFARTTPRPAAPEPTAWAGVAGATLR